MVSALNGRKLQASHSWTCSRPTMKLIERAHFLILIAVASTATETGIVYNGNIFSFHTEHKTFADARDACQVDDGQLAVLITNEDRDWANDTFSDGNPSGTFFWIGGKSDTGNRDFALLDGTKLLDIYWHPVGHVSNCDKVTGCCGLVIKSHHGACSRKCSDTYGFLCQRPQESHWFDIVLIVLVLTSIMILLVIFLPRVRTEYQRIKRFNQRTARHGDHPHNAAGSFCDCKLHAMVQEGP